MSSHLKAVSLEPDVVAAIEAHARNCYPEECCGLIAVDSNFKIRFVYPLSNRDRSSHSFTLDPQEHFAALMHAESRGWDIGGTFHSHPSGPDALSSRDLEGLAAGWIHILVSPDGLSAWRLAEAAATQVEMINE